MVREARPASNTVDRRHLAWQSCAGHPMKLLFLTPYLPGPPIFGGQRRVHGLMGHLAERHDVSVIALVDPSLDHRAGIRDTETYCRSVITVVDAWHKVSGRNKRLMQLGSMLTPFSYEHSLYARPAFQSALDQHLRDREYDVVVSEFVFMAGYRVRGPWPEARRPRLVLDEHNVEYDLIRRTAEGGDLGRRVYNAVNWRKLKREEIAAWERFDGCTVTSTRDEEFVRREAPAVRTAVVPNGVDVDAFFPRPDAEMAPRTLLFFGAINYYPNTEGALYFANEILPLIKARFPDVRFRIVGPVGEGPVMDLRKRGIEVVGFVDDLKTEIDRAAVVVVPLRMGGGTRLKIVEAMAMAKPIVSTRLGAEGLDLTHDEDILLADSPHEFAEQVARVLTDASVADRLGKAARQTAVNRYSWRTASEKMESLFGELLEARASAAEQRTVP
jgi:glycosyltransferase involved in cell wall biosynthesis